MKSSFMRRILLTLASYKEDTYELAVRFLQEEIRRTHAIGVRNIVLHPGAYTDKDAEYGIARIAEGLNEVLEGTKETNVNIALETMAGKGTEIGRSFEEIAAIIDKVRDNDRLTVCMDTCHMHDAGYDLVGNDLMVYWNDFDRIVGLDRVAVVHVNDSKKPARGWQRPPCADRRWLDRPRGDSEYRPSRRSCKGRPLILETPWIGKRTKRSVRCMKRKSLCYEAMR